jgi:hypothetical protein
MCASIMMILLITFDLRPSYSAAFASYYHVACSALFVNIGYAAVPPNAIRDVANRFIYTSSRGGSRGIPSAFALTIFSRWRRSLGSDYVVTFLFEYIDIVTN